MPRVKSACSQGAEFHMVKCPRAFRIRHDWNRRGGGIQNAAGVPIIEKGNTGVVHFFPNIKPVSKYQMGQYRRSAVAQPHPINLSNTSPTNIVRSSVSGEIRSEERRAPRTLVDEPHEPIETPLLRPPRKIRRVSGPVRASVIDFNLPQPRMEGGVPLTPSRRRSSIQPESPEFDFPMEHGFGEQGERPSLVKPSLVIKLKKPVKKARRNTMEFLMADNASWRNPIPSFLGKRARRVNPNPIPFLGTRGR
jgi:hypothetical protein